MTLDPVHSTAQPGSPLRQDRFAQRSGQIAELYRIGRASPKNTSISRAMCVPSSKPYMPSDHQPVRGNAARSNDTLTGPSLMGWPNLSCCVRLIS